MFNCNLTHRTTYETIRSYYGNLETAFADGNYTFVAAFADDEPELLGCALILAGNVPKGLGILEAHEIRTQRADLHRAFAYWCEHQKSKSIELLGELKKRDPDNGLVQRFLAMLEKERINLLVMNNGFDVPTDSMAEQFNIQSIGYSARDDIHIEIDFDGRSLPDLLNRRSFHPDLFYVHRPEYIPIFKHIESLPFEKIAFSTDFDMHIYQKFDDFKKFDRLLVYSSAEHFEAARCFGTNTYTHLFSTVPLDFSMPEKAASNEKKFDLILTGTSFIPFFKDKAKLLAQLSTVDEKYNILIVNSDIPFDAYIKLISESKLSSTFVRFYGSFPTRGVEALSQGLGVLTQENGVMELFFDKDAAGLFPYNQSNIQSVFEDAVQSYQCNRTAVSDAIRLFEKETSLDRLFKFCVFTSLLEKKDRPRQSRPLLMHTKVVGHHGCHGHVAQAPTPEDTLAHLKRIVRVNQQQEENWHGLNHAALTAVYRYQHCLNFKLDSQDIGGPLIDDALNIFGRAIERYPDKMALWFNLARVHFHFGDPDQAEKAFVHILASLEWLELDSTHDDIMAPLFFSENHFPYRDYVDAVINPLIGEAATTSPKNMIAGACAYYLSRMAFKKSAAQSYAHAKQSLDFFPENMFLRTWLVRLLHDHPQLEPDHRRWPMISVHFETAVNQYPRLIHPNIVYYANALRAQKKYSALEDSLKKWYLMFMRVREQFETLALDDGFVQAMFALQEYLPEAAAGLFGKIQAMLDGKEIRQFTAFEMEVIIKFFRDNDKQHALSAILKPDNPLFEQRDFLLCLGDYCLKEKDNQQAARHYLKLLMHAEQNLEFRHLTKIYRFASSLKANGHHDLAEKLFKAFLSSPFDYNTAGVYFHLGELAFWKQDYIQAGICFEQARKIIPDHIKAGEYLDRLSKGH